MRLKIFFLCLTLLVSIFAGEFVNGQIIATVREVKGEAFIIRSEKDTLKAKLFENLYAGDVINVSKESYITLLLQGGKKEIIRGEISYKLAKNKDADNEKSIGKVLWELLVGKSEAMYGKHTVGAVRGLNAVPPDIPERYPSELNPTGENLEYKRFLISPRKGRIDTQTPIIEWMKSPGAESTVLFIFDSIGTEVFRTTLQDTCFSCSESSIKLERGKHYKLWLRVNDTGQNYYDFGIIYILNQEEMNQVNEFYQTLLENISIYDELDQKIIISAFYEKNLLLDNAVKIILEVKPKYENNPVFWNLLSNLHQKLGLISLAKMESSRADALSK